MDKFQVSIFSIEGDKVETEAGLAILPGLNGHVGIMPNMVAYATLLKQGCIYIVSDSGGLKKRLFINKGKALIDNNLLSISVDGKLQNIEDYTLEDAEKEREELNAKLQNSSLSYMHEEYKQALENINSLLDLKRQDVYSFK